MKNLSVLFLLLFVLIACQPAPEVPTPSATPIPTGTSIPTATVIPSPTPTPTESSEEAAARLARSVLAGEISLADATISMRAAEINAFHIAIAAEFNKDRSQKLIFPFMDTGDKPAYAGWTKDGWQMVSGPEDLMLVDAGEFGVPMYEKDGSWWYQDDNTGKFVQTQGPLPSVDEAENYVRNVLGLGRNLESIAETGDGRQTFFAIIIGNATEALHKAPVFWVTESLKDGTRRISHLYTIPVIIPVGNGRGEVLLGIKSGLVLNYLAVFMPNISQEGKIRRVAVGWPNYIGDSKGDFFAGSIEHDVTGHIVAVIGGNNFETRIRINETTQQPMGTEFIDPNATLDKYLNYYLFAPVFIIPTDAIK